VAVLDKQGRLLRAITDGPHGPLQSPFSLALSPNGNLLVLDSDAGLVIAYDAAGKPVRSTAPSLNLSHARGIAVDAAGRVYVADPAANAVYTLGPDLTLVHTEPAQTGSGPALFNQPAAVAVGVDGTMYVADNQDNLIIAFSSAWKSLASWPVAPSDSQHSPRILPLTGGRILVSDPRDGKLLLLGGSDTRAFDLAPPAGAAPCVPLGIAAARLPAVLATCNGAGQVWKLVLPGI
jgi:DNA-binding beta-propeller fold protein YncE